MQSAVAVFLRTPVAMLVTGAMPATIAGLGLLLREGCLAVRSRPHEPA